MERSWKGESLKGWVFSLAVGSDCPVHFLDEGVPVANCGVDDE